MLSTLSPEPTHAPARRPARAAWMEWLPLILIALLYLGASTGPALFDQNEAQYAGAVREMLDRPADYQPATCGRLERGQWFVPTNDGIPRLQKPPLVYWVLMASMRVFGVNEFGARLPNALVSLLWFAATFLLGRRVGGEALGRAAATILATMAGTFIFCHLIAPEPFLATTLTLTFWCFLAACQDPPRAARWMFAAWVFMALGTGCKGLHGALYPLFVAALLAWRHPATRPVWKKLLSPAGPLVFLALLVPWYWAVEARYPGFLRDQFLNEQLGHVINRRYPPDSDRVPFVVFWLEHLAFFLPWTFFIPAALCSRRAPAGGSPRRDVGSDLVACWFAVTTVSILFSTLQDYYLMTAWGPVALWLARAWAGRPGIRSPLPRWTMLAPCLGVAAIGVAAVAAAAWLQTHAAAGSVFTDETTNRDTLLGTLAGFSASAWTRLRPLLWGTGATFLGGGTVAAMQVRRGRWRFVLPVMAVMMVGVLTMAGWGLSVLEDYFSLKQIALAANRQARGDAIVVCAGETNDNPSLLFYLDREIYWVQSHSTVEFASRQLGIGRGLFLSDDDLARRWHSAQPVFLITESALLDHWQTTLALTPAQLQPTARSGTRVMLANGR